MLLSRQRRGFIAAFVFYAIACAPLLAQDTETVSTPPTVGSIEYIPKDWYPRLTGLSVDKSEGDTFSLGGSEYVSGELMVSFFSWASSDLIEADLNIYTTKSISPSNSGTYYMILQHQETLFAVVDAYNDLSEVRSATLVAATTLTATTPPSAGGDAPGGSSGTVTTGSVDGASVTESLWPGDTDGNFQYAIKDVLLSLYAALNLEELSPLAKARADINRNGRVDIQDATMTLGLVIGNGLPPPYGYAASE